MTNNKRSHHQRMRPSREVKPLLHMKEMILWRVCEAYYTGARVCFTHGNDQISGSIFGTARTDFQNYRFKIDTWGIELLPTMTQ